MATIQDYSEFKIKITPEYSNWWSFSFEFFYKDRPLFNPEIIKSGEVKAEEIDICPLLPVLEKAIGCRTPEEIFAWGEWEDEAAIIVEYKKYNKLAEDGFFIFRAFISAYFFKDGRGNTMDQPAGLILSMIERDVLKKFYEDLKAEMVKAEAEKL